MPESRQRPLEALAGDHEHDFLQRRPDWEATTFDRAAYFTVVEVRSGDRTETRFTVMPWAVRFARSRADSCLYAVTASGRFALLDPEKWPEWEQRWRRVQRLPEVIPAVMEKLYRGTITEWKKVSAPQGLGFAIEGRMGSRRVLTTSILRQEGNGVETLSWRYTLEGKVS